jgi:hypothetical protein
VESREEGPENVKMVGLSTHRVTELAILYLRNPARKFFGTEIHVPKNVCHNVGFWHFAETATLTGPSQALAQTQPAIAPIYRERRRKAIASVPSPNSAIDLGSGTAATDPPTWLATRSRSRLGCTCAAPLEPAIAQCVCRDTFVCRAKCRLKPRARVRRRDATSLRNAQSAPSIEWV